MTLESNGIRLCLKKGVKMLAEGSKAPNFALKDQDENLICLNDFIGQKLLIWFYPKSSTPG